MNVFRRSFPGVVLAALMATPVQAAVYSDDLIVQGNGCIGTDCLDGETLDGNGLKLKENNTRIRWHDTTATDRQITNTFENTYAVGEVGRAWRMDANESANGGQNHLMIMQYGLDSSPLLSDGSAPDYDCSGGIPPFPVVGTLPEGDPAEDEFCQLLSTDVHLNGLRFAETAAGGVAVGSEATVADGTVSLGSADLKRRLVRVAHAVEATDALVKGQMEMGVLADRRQQVDAIESQIKSMEKQVSALEDKVGGKRRSSGGNGLALLLLLSLAAFRARR